jgi:hypothetical protein
MVTGPLFEARIQDKARSSFCLDLAREVLLRADIKKGPAIAASPFALSVERPKETYFPDEMTFRMACLLM